MEAERDVSQVALEERAKYGLDRYTGGGVGCGAPEPYVRIQSLAGKNTELCVNPDGLDTIKVLQRRLQLLEGISPEAQRLIYNGKLLHEV